MYRIYAFRSYGAQTLWTKVTKFLPRKFIEISYLVIFNFFLVRIVQKNAEFLKNVHLRGKFLSYTDAKFVIENIGISFRGYWKISIIH